MQKEYCIDEVIQKLTSIINDSKHTGSRVGYFAALYRQVTITVKQRIDEGKYFDDNKRMERFDVIFANRYLTAIEQLSNGSRPTASWDYAFNASEEWWPIVLQHLLFGINAHIGLDLGIAAVQTAGPENLPAMSEDFSRINDLLADLVRSIREKLAIIWPPLGFFNSYLGDVQTGFINFSMVRARNSAWDFAKELASKDENEQLQAILRRDAEVVQISQTIRHPNFLLELVTKSIRVGERGTTSEIIETLEREAAIWSARLEKGELIQVLPGRLI